MNLNEQERLILYNQYEILKQISTDENDKDYYERNQEFFPNKDIDMTMIPFSF